MNREQEFWRKALETEEGCVPPGKSPEDWSASERQHAATCARCQTEMELWRDFMEAPAHPADAGAVTWIASELRRRRETGAKPSRWAWLGRPWRLAAALAGVVLLAAGLNWQIQNRGPADDGAEVFRGGDLAAVAPAGDLDAAPVELRWSGGKAVRYRIEIAQVDGEVLWASEASGSAVTLPAQARAKATPGKTLVWKVRALDGAGRVVAESGAVRFRVRPKTLPPGD